MPKVRKTLSLFTEETGIPFFQGSSETGFKDSYNMGQSYGCGPADYIYNVCDEIIPRLFLGDFCAASNEETMKQFDVIINMTKEKSLEIESKLHIQIPSEDVPNFEILPILNWVVPKIVQFLEEGKKVFVHCKAGISRSATVVIACLMRIKNISSDEAIAFVKTKRVQKTSPNFGFLFALMCFK